MYLNTDGTIYTVLTFLISSMCVKDLLFIYKNMYLENTVGT